MRFVPYCTIFSNKQPQKGCKCRPFEINIHFVAFTNGPFLASKQTFARIDFFAASWAIGDKMGTHGVEFSTENITFLHPCHGLQQANGAEFWILAYLCSVLRTWEECLSCFCITKIIYSYQYWFTIEFCSPWFCITRTTNASQLIDRLEVKLFLNLKIY